MTHIELNLTWPFRSIAAIYRAQDVMKIKDNTADEKILKCDASAYPLSWKVFRRENLPMLSQPQPYHFLFTGWLMFIQVAQVLYVQPDHS